MLFQFAPDSTSEDTENWSPFMISKKSIDLRQRKVKIWATEQFSLGEKVVLLVPAVIFFSTAHNTGSAK